MIVAQFADAAALRAACAHLRSKKVAFETYSPAPIEDDAASPLPVIIMAAGLLGAAGSFALQSYASLIAYPMEIGNRPLFAWPSFIPTAFENGVLVAVAAGVIGFLAINRMPRLYHPLDEAPTMREASRDGWFIAVNDTARPLLDGLSPIRIDEVAA